MDDCFDLADLVALTIAATEQALTGQPGPMPSPQGDGAHEPYPEPIADLVARADALAALKVDA